MERSKECSHVRLSGAEALLRQCVHYTIKSAVYMSAHTWDVACTTCFFTNR